MILIGRFFPKLFRHRAINCLISRQIQGIELYDLAPRLIVADVLEVVPIPEHRVRPIDGNDNFIAIGLHPVIALTHYADRTLHIDALIVASSDGRRPGD